MKHFRFIILTSSVSFPSNVKFFLISDFFSQFRKCNSLTPFFRPTPHRLNSGIVPSSTLESDQLYPEDYSYTGGGYFNPLTSNSPGGSPATYRSPMGSSTLPRGMMYQAVNPLKDYGYPSDYGLPMTSIGSNHCFITSNPLNELEEDTEMALGGRQQAMPQQPHNVITKPMNLSNSSTGSAASTLSPLRGQLSSSGIGGDLSTASGNRQHLTKPCYSIKIYKKYAARRSATQQQD